MGRGLLAKGTELQYSGHHQLWGVAFFFFVIGDILTTGFGIEAVGLAEASPFLAPLLRQYGIAVLLPVKAITLGGFFLLWKTVAAPSRVGIPIGLAVVGGAATAWNSYLIFVLLF